MNLLRTLVVLGIKHLVYYVRERYIDKPKYRPTYVNLSVISSPNMYKDQPGRKVKYIVLHSTESSTLESAVRWMKDPSSKVSAHYVIGKDGSVVQMVELDNIAWHMGKSSWEGHTDGELNRLSVAIELVNKNDGIDVYPDAQINSCLSIVNGLCTYYGLDGTAVIRHKDAAPGRKRDTDLPDYDEFKRSLSFYQEKTKALTNA